jgi:hypothetical protein
MLALVIMLAGCVTSTQKDLAKHLYNLAWDMDDKLIASEELIGDAMKSGDAATIEKAIILADGYKREWKKESASASGALASASAKFERSLELRIGFYEEASKTALYHSVEASREAVRKQTEAYDVLSDALDNLEELSHK